MQNFYTDGQIRSALPIKKGMSGDRKFLLTLQSGEKRLLRVGQRADLTQKESEFRIARQMFALGVSMPEPLDFGVCEDGAHIYTLSSTGKTASG